MGRVNFLGTDYGTSLVSTLHGAISAKYQLSN